jgi:hypothetical protein
MSGSIIAPALRPEPTVAEPVSPLPPPEQVFLDWLMWLPADADIEAAARREIARLDRRMPLAAGALRLRALFQALTAGEQHGSLSTKT